MPRYIPHSEDTKNKISQSMRKYFDNVQTADQKQLRSERLSKTLRNKSAVYKWFMAHKQVIAKAIELINEENEDII